MNITPQREFGFELNDDDDDDTRTQKEKYELTRRTQMLISIRALLLGLNNRLGGDGLPDPMELWRLNVANVPTTAMDLFGDTIKALLCTPVTSCTSERVFSLAGRMQDSGDCCVVTRFVGN